MSPQRYEDGARVDAQRNMKLFWKLNFTFAEIISEVSEVELRCKMKRCVK